MASWSAKLSQPDNSSLPRVMEPGKKGETALEVFVDGALTKIYNESSGRSKDQKSIREACKGILGVHHVELLGLFLLLAGAKNYLFHCRCAA